MEDGSARARGGHGGTPENGDGMGESGHGGGTRGGVAIAEQRRMVPTWELERWWWRWGSGACSPTPASGAAESGGGARWIGD